jgi:hypothetical protein
MTALAPEAAFVEENSFLYAVLGALSFARRFRSTLDARIQPPAGAGVAAGNRDADAANEARLHALLGLVALSGALDRAAETLGPGAPPTARPNSENARERLRELLR